MEIGKLQHDEDARRFVLNVAGSEAFVDYTIDGDVYHLNYSEVPVALRGQGIGKILVEGTFEHLAAEKKSMVAHCGYIRAIAKRSDRWRELVGTV